MDSLLPFLLLLSYSEGGHQYKRTSFYPFESTFQNMSTKETSSYLLIYILVCHCPDHSKKNTAYLLWGGSLFLGLGKFFGLSHFKLSSHSFAVCLETVGSEESSFYLLPEGIPQATAHQSKITLILFWRSTSRSVIWSLSMIKIQDDPPSIVANSSANSIHVSSGEINYSDPVKKIKSMKKQTLSGGRAMLHCTVLGATRRTVDEHFIHFEIFRIILNQITYHIKRSRTLKNEKI